jgi:putative transposase
MDNHVHHILVPATADGLRAALGDYPMDDAHLMAAVRYVEQNPVTAGMVARPQDWRWSGAASHIAGRRTRDDPLTDVEALAVHVPNWRAMPRRGRRLASWLGTAWRSPRRSRPGCTGRLLGTEEWIARQENALARKLTPAKRGPKPQPRIQPDIKYCVPGICFPSVASPAPRQWKHFRPAISPSIVASLYTPTPIFRASAPYRDFRLRSGTWCDLLSSNGADRTAGRMPTHGGECLVKGDRRAGRVDILQWRSFETPAISRPPGRTPYDQPFG